MAGSELLWWDELQEAAHANQSWRIRACLVRAASALRPEGGVGGGGPRPGEAHGAPRPLQLRQDRKRVEERLQRSRDYLADPQASVREEAVRFIGELPPPAPTTAPGPPLALPGAEADGRLLSLGLAAEHHREQSEEKVNEIIASERGGTGRRPGLGEAGGVQRLSPPSSRPGGSWRGLPGPSGGCSLFLSSRSPRAHDGRRGAVSARSDRPHHPDREAASPLAATPAGPLVHAGGALPRASKILAGAEAEAEAAARAPGESRRNFGIRRLLPGLSAMAEHGQLAGLQPAGVLDASRKGACRPPAQRNSHLFIQSLLGSLLSVLHSPPHPPSSAPASLEQLPSSRSSGPRPGRHIPLTAPQGQGRGGRGPLPTS